jgi:predicted PurR-regulated permease PerM
MDSEKILDISWKTIGKLALASFVFYLIYIIKDILVWFLFALVISVLFNPAIDFLQRKKVPRILGITLVYFGFFGFMSFLVFSSIPLFSDEIKQFFNSFPAYFEKISPTLQLLGFKTFENAQDFMAAIQSGLLKLSDSVFNVFFAIFGGVFATLFVFATAIFISLEEKMAEKALILVFPPKYENFIINLWKKCQKKVAGWFLARILVCIFVGVFSFIAFLLFKLDYPFVLGLLAGTLNFIPYIGPIFTGILLFFASFQAGLLKTIFVLAVFVLIQQIENNIISPILMKKFIGIPPVLVLISMVIGGKIWGFAGLILMIPLAGIVFEFLKEFLQKRRDKKVLIVNSIKE